MKILGGGSLASRLRFVLGLVLAVMLIVGALNLFLVAFLLIEPTHPVQRHVTVTTVFTMPCGEGAATNLLHSRDPGALVEGDLLAFVNYRPGNRWHLLALAAGYFAIWGLWLTVVLELRRLFAGLTSGEPFLRSNVPRLRLIGWAVIAAMLAENLLDWGWVALMRAVLTVGGETPRVPLAFVFYEMRLDLLFVGVAVLVLAEIFRLGAALQEEQALTV